MRKKELKLIVTFHTTADAMAMEKCSRLPGGAVFFAPGAEVFHQREQRDALFRQRIFHARRDLREFLAFDESARIELLQRGAEGGEGDVADEAVQFVEAHRVAVLREGIDDYHLVFAAYQGERVTESRILQLGPRSGAVFQFVIHYEILVSPESYRGIIASYRGGRLRISGPPRQNSLQFL